MSTVIDELRTCARMLQVLRAAAMRDGKREKFEAATSGIASLQIHIRALDAAAQRSSDRRRPYASTVPSALLPHAEECPPTRLATLDQRYAPTQVAP